MSLVSPEAATSRSVRSRPPLSVLKKKKNSLKDLSSRSPRDAMPEGGAEWSTCQGNPNGKETNASPHTRRICRLRTRPQPAFAWTLTTVIPR